MFKRQMAGTLKSYENFPVIAIVGPRQSGKTTLAQAYFPKHTYVSFENPRTRELAQNEPEHFLSINHNDHGIIIDEFQYVPQILSYIQLDVDANKRKNYFILTGSQNFLAKLQAESAIANAATTSYISAHGRRRINQSITQSLAGRVGILTLQPLCLQELITNKILSNTAAEVVYNGFYPRLYDEHFAPNRFYPSYIQTYVERDVRQLINIGDLASFQKFIQLCAARIGNLLNLSDLATVCGISVPTARRWLSVLEASYIVFLLEPHYNNFNKRLTKMPKLYFYDTGLACNLLRIASAQELIINQHWGSLFECFIISDLAKQYFNQGQRPPLYFWRDKNGRLEVDCLVDRGNYLLPIEIKASEVVVSDFFHNLNEWNELAYGANHKKDATKSFLIYAGAQTQERASGTAIGWKDSGTFINLISGTKTKRKKPLSRSKK